MPDGFDWLPDFVPLDGFVNDWPTCRDRLYGEFYRDFIASRPEFFGKRVGVSRRRIIDGREAAFHHCVTEGEGAEEDRIPDYLRCQRLRWPRKLIEALGTDRVKWWKEVEGRKRRAYVSLPDFSYLVILEEMESHCVLVTAYPVDREHTRRNHLKRYEAAGEKG
jgi:hypothetical protein